MSVNDDVFAERWYAAWNAHDLDAIMEFYADDVEFSSPCIAALGLVESGVIVGKPMLRAYLELALARARDLRFVPESVCVGARGHTLIYRNHRGERAAEHHQLDAAGRIVRAEATYEATGSTVLKS
ncbi:MAG: nuclear transport factor 2 family protein [Hyphomonadaceae bacterium]|nr:nuclear transport factor 2 family protein [Hyphomonadaceae bacterium]